MPDHDTASALPRKTLLIGTGALLLCLLLIGTFLLLNLQQAKIKENTRALARHGERIFDELLRVESQTLSALLLRLQAAEGLQQPMREGRRDALLDQALPLYRRYNSQFDITHLYFHQPDGICFLRAHSPGRHGDHIKRESLRQARERGETATGIELGPLGTFTLRAVTPWSDGRQVIGYLEVGKEIDHLDTLIENSLEVRTLQLIDKQRLDRETWTSHHSVRPLAPGWDYLPRHVLATPLTDEEAQALRPLLLRCLDQPADHTLQCRLENRRHAAGGFVLHDMSGQPVGRSIVLRDIHAEWTTLRRFLLAALLLGLPLIILLLIAGARLIRHLEQRIEIAQHDLAREAQLQQRHARESEERSRHLRGLLDSIPSPVFIKDGMSRYTDCNEAFSRDIIGLPREQIIGHTLPELIERILPEALETYTDKDRELLEGPDPHQRYEAPVKTAEGQVRPFMFHKARLDDDQGRCIGLVGVMIDLSEKAAREEELRRAHHETQQILAASPPLCVIDRQGRLLRQNEAFTNFFASSPEPVPALTDCRTLGLSAWVEGAESPLGRILAGAECVEREYTHPATENRPARPYLLCARPLLDSDKRPRGAVLSLTDLTENRRLEDERRRLHEERERAGKLESLGIMASGVAHDFNNLMMSIIGNAQMLQEDHHDNPETLFISGEIESAASRASEISQNMLLYSGHAASRTETIPLDQVLQECDKLIRIWLPPNCSLTFEAPDILPPLTADIDRVRQMLMNLVRNAAEAIGPERPGKVVIRIGQEQCHSEPQGVAGYTPHRDGPHLFIEVEDNGEGMSEQTLDKIFDPFFTTRMTGRGLGLSVLLGIVRQHEGFVRVKSRPGQGTQVRIYLPIPEQTKAP